MPGGGNLRCTKLIKHKNAIPERQWPNAGEGHVQHPDAQWKVHSNGAKQFDEQDKYHCASKAPAQVQL